MSTASNKTEPVIMTEEQLRELTKSMVESASQAAARTVEDRIKEIQAEAKLAGQAAAEKVIDKHEERRGKMGKYEQYARLGFVGTGIAFFTTGVAAAGYGLMRDIRGNRANRGGGRNTDVGIHMNRDGSPDGRSQPGGNNPEGSNGR